MVSKSRFKYKEGKLGKVVSEEEILRKTKIPSNITLTLFIQHPELAYEMYYRRIIDSYKSLRYAEQGVSFEIQFDNTDKDKQSKLKIIKGLAKEEGYHIKLSKESEKAVMYPGLIARGAA